MNEINAHAEMITASSILSGLGSLDREAICSLISILEEIGAKSLAQGAIKDAGKWIKIVGQRSTATNQSKQQLLLSPTSDAVLRHRLWVRITESLAVPTTVPLSSRSARRSAASLAVRASERLTPSVIAQRKKVTQEVIEEDVAAQIGAKAAGLWNAGKKMLAGEKPISFPDLVREEIINMLADKELMSAAVSQADPKIQDALRNAHGAAQKAIALGGGWAAFAAIVANAGFLPYILAAQASAWIPFVGGPALVSFLAVLVNPFMVAAGIGALGWVAVGKGSSVVRSQVAARICILLALHGSQKPEEGLHLFLAGIRALDREATSTFDHLKKAERQALRTRLSLVSGRFLSAVPASAGAPPAPWDRHFDGNDVADAPFVASLTAGEMLWHAVAIDENVLKAADFSRAADLGDPFSFAAAAQDLMLEGAGYALRGYTAERLVMDALVADGHDVQLAEASNTPGLDLVVDGAPVQVKCGSELSNLVEHFEKYPDIPVIANQELAEQAAKSGAEWVDMVTTLPGFELSLIEDQVADALGHAVDLSEPGVLEWGISVGVLRGGIEVAQGRIPMSDLPAWLLLDGASRGALGFVGLKAGGWLGLVAIGPAGALILGPAAGCAALLGNGLIKTQAQQVLMRGWTKELLNLGSDLHVAISATLERRIHHLIERSARLRTVFTPGDDFGSWTSARSNDDLVAAIEDLAELGGLPNQEDHCVELLFKAATLAPADASVLLTASKVKQHFAAKPGLQELLVDKQLEAAGSFLDKHLWSRFGDRAG